MYTPRIVSEHVPSMGTCIPQIRSELRLEMTAAVEIGNDSSRDRLLPQNGTSSTATGKCRCVGEATVTYCGVGVIGNGIKLTADPYG